MLGTLKKKPNKEEKQMAEAASGAETKANANAEAKAKKRDNATEGSVLYEILVLLLKVVGILAVLAVLFTFVFGITRVTDLSMYSAVKDGDLVIYYRMDKDFSTGELAVLEYDGEKQVRRVVAVAGDEVDIDLENYRLIINGSPQAESDIHELTARFDTGVEFPLVVGEGQVFLLGDGRQHSIDSRMYGCVNVKDLLGKASAILRVRGL